jgi:acylphosphatase
MQAMKWLISGRVHGVGYRNFTHRHARQLNIKGTVRNLVDKRVEVVAFGTPANLLKFYSLLCKGPAFSHVEKIDETQIDVTENDLNGFDILI